MSDRAVRFHGSSNRASGGTAHQGLAETDVLLTVEQAAEYMNTKVRFVRRLIAERRIAFVKLGRHVRLSRADVDAFVAAGRVEPVTLTWTAGRPVF